jgi:hypothetical protein
MRRLCVIISLICVSSLRAQPVPSYLFVGDALTPREKAVVISEIGTPTAPLPLLVRKADVDGDGQIDIVTLLGGQSLTVFLKRGASFQTYQGGFRLDTSAEHVQLNIVSGLQGRKEILAKVGGVCFVAYMSEVRMRASGTPLEYERFQCEGPKAYERFSEARGRCLSEGGNWGPEGMLRHGSCVRKMADGGKPCATKGDCLGKCVYDGPPVPLGTQVIGKCSVSDRGFGCFELVGDGLYIGRLCAD